jgi:hypothetical protein
MTEPDHTVSDLPVLALPPHLTQRYISQAITMIDAAIEYYRDHAPLSTSERAALEARRREQRARAIAAARPLQPAEATEWAALRDLVETERWQVSGARGEFTGEVRLAPLDNTRWAMEATWQGAEDTPATVIVVSCRTEQIARELADETIRATDPAALRTLLEHAQVAALRQACAARDVTETPEELRERAAEAIRRNWEPPLAAHTLHPDNPAREPLITRLHQLEDYGYSMDRTLSGLDQDELTGQHVHNPTALAEWLCEGHLHRLDPDRFPLHPADSRVRSGPPRPRPAPPASDEPAAQAQDREVAPERPRGVDTQWPDAALQRVVNPALERAFSPQVRETLRGGRDFAKLATALVAYQTDGQDLGPLLAGISEEHLIAARTPNAYLLSIVTRRVHQATPAPDQTNRVAMQRLVRAAFTDHHQVADAILTDRAWPWMARIMSESVAAHGGDSVGDNIVVDMLRDLPPDATRTARAPAAYAGTELRRRLAALDGGEPDVEQRPVSPATGKPLDPASAIDRVLLEESAAGVDPGQLRRAAQVVVRDGVGLGVPGTLRRTMGIDHNEAHALRDALADRGVISQPDELSHRRVLMTPEQLDALGNDWFTTSPTPADTTPAQTGGAGALTPEVVTPVAADAEQSAARAAAQQAGARAVQDAHHADTETEAAQESPDQVVSETHAESAAASLTDADIARVEQLEQQGLVAAGVAAAARAARALAPPPGRATQPGPGQDRSTRTARVVHAVRTPGQNRDNTLHR